MVYGCRIVFNRFSNVFMDMSLHYVYLHRKIYEYLYELQFFFERLVLGQCVGNNMLEIGLHVFSEVKYFLVGVDFG